MTRAADLSRSSDRCAACRHAAVEPQPGADNLLCTHPEVRAAYRRLRVAAAVARDWPCRASWHREARK